MPNHEQDTVNQPAEENKISLQDFLKQSYNQAKKQIETGIHRVQDGVTYLKEEISEMYSHSGYYFSQMALPVNNFLKDFSQIDTELSQEISKDAMQFMTLDGKLVPIDQVLSRPMEENY